LDDVLAEVTFDSGSQSGSDTTQLAEPTGSEGEDLDLSPKHAVEIFDRSESSDPEADGWGVEKPSDSAVEDTMQSDDDGGDGDAWERAGFESWGEEDDEGRPRRPWE
jgi:hypothetical protein